MYPRARSEGLVITDQSDETLVYDEVRHKAHCLNRTAAFVWQHCDGQTDEAELAMLVRREFGVTEGEEDLVALALDELNRAKLLVDGVKPATDRMLLRRQLLKTALVGLAAVPVVLTVLAPRAMASASTAPPTTTTAAPTPTTTTIT